MKASPVNCSPILYGMKNYNPDYNPEKDPEDNTNFIFGGKSSCK